jgi:large subunit ribosomal protein L5
VEGGKPMNSLSEKYKKEVIPKLVEKYGYTSVMQAPKLEKIVINIGVGDATENEKYLDAAVNELQAITGAKPVITKAKKSIAGFHLREGQAIGCKVTLRGEKMWTFLDKLIRIALPSVRDFRGVSTKAFDGRGNYTLGIKEQMIFAEIEYDNIVKTRGMDIVFVTTAKTNEEAFDLLNEIGIPFRK